MLFTFRRKFSLERNGICDYLVPVKPQQWPSQPQFPISYLLCSRNEAPINQGLNICGIWGRIGIDGMKGGDLADIAVVKLVEATCFDYGDRYFRIFGKAFGYCEARGTAADNLTLLCYGVMERR